MSNPENRQATDSIRGYNYQFWQSVLAWICLEENQVLHLECNEDFDIFENDLIISTQVKDTQGSGNITLRTPDVVDAINNYWALKKREEDSKILFRFMTTSGVGIERPNPFDAGTSGLRLWERGKKEDEALKTLIDFLIAENKLDSEVIEFLKSASFDEIREGLISPIAWDTDSQNSIFIEAAVKEKLSHHGNNLGILPSDSSKVSNRLFEEVARISSEKNNRILKLVDFFKIFEEATTLRIPTSSLNRLISGISVPSLPGIEEAPILSPTPLQWLPPPLPSEVLLRENLVEQIRANLDLNGIVVLTSTTGMGKTVASNLIAQSCPDEWFWVNLRGLKGEQISDELKKLNVIVQGECPNIVLDDIDFENEAIKFENLLRGLLCFILGKNKKCILTSQNNLPEKLSLEMDLQSGSFLVIPPLDETEIIQFLRSCGCGETEATSWAKIILVRTKGHPQLVHASIRGLKNKDWPNPSASDFLKSPEEVDSTKVEAQKLLKQLYDQDARELIYRLSIITQPFRKDQVIEIGGIEPKIDFPGESFEVLKGPWLEEINGAYFSVSPLLENLGSNIWAQDRIEGLNGEIAEKILKCGNLTQIEAGNILLHGLLGKSSKALFPLVYSLIQYDPEDIANLATSFSWFPFFCIRPIKPLFPEDPLLNCYLRLLQLKVAGFTAPKLGQEISTAFEKEIQLIANEETREVFNFQLQANKLTLFKIHFTPGELLKALVSMNNSLKKFGSSFPDSQIPGAGPGIASRMECEDGDQLEILPLTFIFIIERIQSIDDLRELFEGLKILDDETRKKILNYKYNVDADFKKLFDNAWISELNKEGQDWNYCVEIISEIAITAKGWKANLLAAHAFRSIAIIKDEYLDLSSEAIDLVINAKNELGDFVALDDELATIYFRNDELEKALNIWEPLLVSWNPPASQGDITPIMACRKAAFCACEIGRWDKGAVLNGEGVSRANELGLNASQTGFLFDQGFAFLKSEENEKAVNAFREGIELLSKLPDPKENPSSFRVWKYSGGLIAALQSYLNSKNIEEFQKISPGFCSNPEINEELLGTPLLPVEFYESYLADIEFKLTSNVEIFEKLFREIEYSKKPAMKLLIYDLGIQIAFSTLSFKELPTLFRGWADSVIQVRKLDCSGMEPWDDFDDVTVDDDLSMETIEHVHECFFPALVGLASKGPIDKEVIMAWSEIKISDTLKKSIEDWLEWQVEIFNLPIQEGVFLIKNTEEKRGKRILAALYVGISEEVGLDDLFYSHICLFQALTQSSFKKMYSNYLSSIISKQWIRVIRNPALLLNPRTTISEIENACASEQTGTKKLAGILLATSNAVSMSISEEVLYQLKNLSQ